MTPISLTCTLSSSISFRRLTRVPPEAELLSSVLLLPATVSLRVLEQVILVVVGADARSRREDMPLGQHRPHALLRVMEVAALNQDPDDPGLVSGAQGEVLRGPVVDPAPATHGRTLLHRDGHAAAHFVGRSTW